MAYNKDNGWLNKEDREIAEACISAAKIARAAARTGIRVRALDEEPARAVRPDMASSVDYSGGEQTQPRQEPVENERAILNVVLNYKLANLRRSRD